MITTTGEDGAAWYRCEEYGVLFDVRSDTEAHEENCDTDSPSCLR